MSDFPRRPLPAVSGMHAGYRPLAFPAVTLRSAVPPPGQARDKGSVFDVKSGAKGYESW